MSISHRYRSGVSNAASYQVSGKPFLTGSDLNGSGANDGELEINFPTVTKSFTVVNRGANPIQVHFDTKANPNVAAQRHVMTLPQQHDSFGFDIRTTRVYISMSGSSGTSVFELHAELTGIPREDMDPDIWISGSGINVY